MRSAGKKTPGAKKGPASAAGRSAKAAAGAASGWSPRDLLVPYVLLAVSARRAHGYYIEQYLRGLGLAQVEMTRLYRTLRQLEKNGLVTSAWEAGEGGPARRVYQLTDAGRVWLQSGAAMLDGYRAAIDAFFGRYQGGAKKKERGG
jgi:poly-beta-hydroxybutyrate-responsive repressor